MRPNFSVPGFPVWLCDSPHNNRKWLFPSVHKQSHPCPASQLSLEPRLSPPAHIHAFPKPKRGPPDLHVPQRSILSSTKRAGAFPKHSPLQAKSRTPHSLPNANTNNQSNIHTCRFLKQEQKRRHPENAPVRDPLKTFSPIITFLSRGFLRNHLGSLPGGLVAFLKAFVTRDGVSGRTEGERRRGKKRGKGSRRDEMGQRDGDRQRTRRRKPGKGPRREGQRGRKGQRRSRRETGRDPTAEGQTQNPK